MFLNNIIFSCAAGAFVLFSVPASAADASIEQLGSAAIQVNPSSEARKISSPKSQDLGDAPGGENPEAGNANRVPDYQGEVLNNNYMTAYGRVKTTTENENNSGPMEANEPNTVPVAQEKPSAEKKSGGNDKLLQQEKKYVLSHPKPKNTVKAPDMQELPQ
jgi:hypothetical protein